VVLSRVEGWLPSKVVGWSLSGVEGWSLSGVEGRIAVLQSLPADLSWTGYQALKDTPRWLMTEDTGNPSRCAI
jgi:hypothetical protein